MICKYPYYWKPAKHLNKLGKEVVSKLKTTPFPCGRCLHCRIDRSIKWRNRIVLECLDHEYNSFVTLTYNDDFLPCNAELYPDDVTRFFKRYRKNSGQKVRYFYCGEYGAQNMRPHYHIAFFNCSVAEKRLIEKCWSFEGVPMGHVHVGDLNKDSARYITSYIMKGANRSNDYTNKKFLQGRHPEFQRMSRKPGIGSAVIKRIAEEAIGKTQKFNKIAIGKQKVYLDRYLKEEVRKVLGNDTNYDDFTEYVNSIYKDVNSGSIEMNYESLNYQKQKNREKKYKIFSQKRRV